MLKREIRIGGRPYELRYNFAGLYMFEEVAGRAFDARKLWHRHLLYWCMLRANNKDAFDMDFDAFVEELNTAPGLATELDTAFTAVAEERAEQMRGSAEDEKKSPAGGS